MHNLAPMSWDAGSEWERIVQLARELDERAAARLPIEPNRLLELARDLLSFHEAVSAGASGPFGPTSPPPGR